MCLVPAPCSFSPCPERGKDDPVKRAAEVLFPS